MACEKICLSHQPVPEPDPRIAHMREAHFLLNASRSSGVTGSNRNQSVCPVVPPGQAELFGAGTACVDRLRRRIRGGVLLRHGAPSVTVDWLREKAKLCLKDGWEDLQGSNAATVNEAGMERYFIQGAGTHVWKRATAIGQPSGACLRAIFAQRQGVFTTRNSH